jgi:hypothetical protein
MISKGFLTRRASSISLLNKETHRQEQFSRWLSGKRKNISPDDFLTTTFTSLLVIDGPF